MKIKSVQQYEDVTKSGAEPMIAAVAKFLKWADDRATNGTHWEVLNKTRFMLGQKPMEMGDGDYWAQRDTIKSILEKWGII